MIESKSFELQKDRGVTIVLLPAEFTSGYESSVRELSELLDIATTIDPARMVLDLQPMKYVGSAFIGFLISLSSRLRERSGGRLALSGVAPFIRMALQATRTDLLLELHDSRNDAVESLATC